MKREKNDLKRLIDRKGEKMKEKKQRRNTQMREKENETGKK